MPDAADLDPLAARLLAAALRRLAELVEVDLHKLPTDRAAAAEIRREVGDARRNVLALDLDRWLGHAPDSAERKRCHRALGRLETAGWVKPLAGPSGRRTTHLLIEVES